MRGCSSTTDFLVMSDPFETYNREVDKFLAKPTFSQNGCDGLAIGAPDKEFEEGEPHDMKVYYPVDPKQLPKELDGVAWPPP